MGRPGGITKDTSARKNTACMGPHDAALQAYMQSFIQSIDQGYKAEAFGRQAEHGRDVEALRTHINSHYTKAYAELGNQYAADQEQIAAKRNAKMLELTTDFAQDALAAIARHHSVASASGSHTAAGPSDSSTAGEANSTSKNVEEALARASASSIKKEPVSEDQSTEPHADGTEESSTTPPEQQSVKTENTEQPDNMPNATEDLDTSMSNGSPQDVPAEAPPCSQSKPWWKKYPTTPMTQAQQSSLHDGLVSLGSLPLAHGAGRYTVPVAKLQQKLLEGQYTSLQEFAKNFHLSLHNAAEVNGQDPSLTGAVDGLKIAFEPALAGIMAMEDAVGRAEAGQNEKSGRADSVVDEG